MRCSQVSTPRTWRFDAEEAAKWFLLDHRSEIEHSKSNFARSGYVRYRVDREASTLAGGVDDARTREI